MADRVIVYPGEIPQDTDLLDTNRFSMVGLGMALLAVLGSGTYVDGLACAPGTGLTVNVGQGAIYTLAAVDAATYGSLAADTADQIVQQGLTFGQTSLSCPAPATAGQSIVYLVEAQFQQVDGGSTVLNYYNASNPSQPLFGAGGNGQAQNTIRKGVCALQVKAGTAATTGSQVAPSADAGWTPLYTVTVANGQGSITAGNIATASGAPFIAAKLGTLMQMHSGNPNGALAGSAGTVTSAPSLAWDYTNNILWACTTTGTASTAVWVQIGGGGGANPPYWCGTSAGSANAQTLTTTPSVSSLSPGQRLTFIAGFTNTGPLTLTVNGTIGPYTAKRPGPGGVTALGGGEVVAGNLVEVEFDGTRFQFLSMAHGTAEQANASSNTGTVAAVSGATTAGNLPTFSDATGTITDSGASIGSLSASASAALYQLGYLL